MKIDKLIVHNFGGFYSNPRASTQHLEERHIESAHRQRWEGFTSELNGSHIGYNGIIWGDGTFGQYRYIGEQTAAVRGYNRGAAHLCFAGNFTEGVDRPKSNQIQQFTSKGRALLMGNPESVGLKVKPGTTFDIKKVSVRPHRYYGQTTCYGTGLSDTWARDLLVDTPDKRELMKQLVKLYMRLIDLLQKKQALQRGLGASGREDPELLPDNIKEL